MTVNAFIYTPVTFCLACLFGRTRLTPFVFAEREFELVSGFNVEYSAGGRARGSVVG
jgi:NADH:ubiquinone oxidoreductase subunit H